jgi:hypothetical protein
MSILLTYELRQRPAGRGWAAYANEEAETRFLTEYAIDAFFTKEVRLSDLPAKLPWVGALRLAAGPWIVMWRSAGEPRLSGAIVSDEMWRHANRDPAAIVAEADAAFSGKHFEPSDTPAWLDTVESLTPAHSLGPTCIDYLPVAVRLLHASRQQNPPSGGCATAWVKNVARPTGLDSCPFLVTDDGPATRQQLLTSLQARSDYRPHAPTIPAAAQGKPSGLSRSEPVSEELLARLAALESSVLLLAERLPGLEAAPARRHDWSRKQAVVAMALVGTIALASFGFGWWVSFSRILVTQTEINRTLRDLQTTTTSVATQVGDTQRVVQEIQKSNAAAQANREQTERAPAAKANPKKTRETTTDRRREVPKP